MPELTLRQRKLLKLLTLDARLPKKTLASAVTLSQDAVAYQHHKLITEDKLVLPVASFDARVLGYRYVHYFAQAALDDALLRKLVALPFVSFVMTCVGRFNLQLIVLVKDEDQKRKFVLIKKLTTRTDELILYLVDEYSWTHLLPVLDVPVTFKPPRTHPFTDKRQLATRAPTATYVLDDTDKALLPQVIADPCGSYMALARESNLSHETVRLRFRKWLAAGLLLGVGAVPDYAKFGYFANFLLIKADDDAARIGRALKELPFVFYAARMHGSFDYLIYTYDRDPREFAEHAQTIRALFTKLERIELFVFDRVHSYRQFPMDAL